MWNIIWKIKTILNDFIKSKNLQEFINHRFYDDSVIMLSKNGPYISVNTDYAVFHFDSMLNTIEEAERDYNVEGIRPTDIVLDIGACIGAFSLKACKSASHVFAVEPIMTERLKQNIALNNVKNITVLDCALGNGEQELEWGGNTKKIKCISLSEIINLCGGHVDFLKCDCEGGEWSISPDELKDIKIIEAEIHGSQSSFDKFGDMLNKAGFEYNSLSNPSVHLHIVHAKRKE
ncbi:FkbM family methyltransferase [Candidatus Pacearchaeota archaeon]|nr:FkbM family methyltransferase [Candidatus Pacearchaeota archaeon]